VTQFPLKASELSLVFGGREDQQRKVHKEPLRMLAVFSLPLGVSALNLRHERYELRRMIRRIAADRGLDFELRVLQYSVTQAALKRMLREGPGWDIVHFSGHGLASRLILENEDGRRAIDGCRETGTYFHRNAARTGPTCGRGQDG
jgi:hypothetical protein